MNKKGRWKPRSRKVNNGKMDLKSLKRSDEVKKSFLDAVAREFTKPEQLNSGNLPEQMISSIIKCLNSAAESCIPKATRMTTKEISGRKTYSG